MAMAVADDNAKRKRKPGAGGSAHVLADQSQVIDFLSSPGSHGLAGGEAVRRIDTHGAMVFLAGERVYKIVDTGSPKQEFWHVGTSMAYLAVLYDVLRTQWDCSEQKARPYLDAALALLGIEATMPLDTYLWPSKCKVGWGAGELLRVLVQHSLGDEGTIEKAYRAAERVAIFTFMGNQLPSGGWAPMHYPLSELIPEMAFSYKPLKGAAWPPPERIDGSQTIWLPGEEITGEFLGEMKCIERSVAAWVREPRTPITAAS